MVDTGPSAPDILVPPSPPVQPMPEAPQQPKQPILCAQQGQQIIHVSWSHFNPEYLEKLEEDAEAH